MFNPSLAPAPQHLIGGHRSTFCFEGTLLASLRPEKCLILGPFNHHTLIVQLEGLRPGAKGQIFYSDVNGRVELNLASLREGLLAASLAYLRHRPSWCWESLRKHLM